MSDNVKMLLRYAVTAGVSYAVGKGWIAAAAANTTTQVLLELGAAVIAAAPVIYAWFKIDNAPKTT